MAHVYNFIVTSWGGGGGGGVFPENFNPRNAKIIVCFY